MNAPGGATSVGVPELVNLGVPQEVLDVALSFVSDARDVLHRDSSCTEATVLLDPASSLTLSLWSERERVCASCWLLADRDREASAWLRTTKELAFLTTALGVLRSVEDPVPFATLESVLLMLEECDARPVPAPTSGVRQSPGGASGMPGPSSSSSTSLPPTASSGRGTCSSTSASTAEATRSSAPIL